MDELTPWFDHAVKPVHVGWYDTINIPPDWADPDFPDFIEQFYFRKWWNGIRWTYGPNEQDAFVQRTYWRGRTCSGV